MIRKIIHRIGKKFGHFVMSSSPPSLLIDEEITRIFDSITIETFGYCNRHCNFCFNASKFHDRSKGIMGEEDWVKIIDELSSVTYFQFTKQVLETLRSSGLPLHMSKCLKVLKHYEFIDQDEFLKHIEYCIGIQALDKYRDLLLKYTASFGYRGRISPHFYGEPLLDKRIVRLIAYAREKCPHAYLRIQSNGDLLTESLLLELIDSGLDEILVTNYDDKERTDLVAISQKYPDYVRYRSYKDFAIKNRAGKIFSAENLQADIPCLRPSKQMVVTWNGNVVLCCNDYYEKHVFGNVKKESLVEIWNSSKLKEYREILLKAGGRKRIDICQGCDV